MPRSWAMLSLTAASSSTMYTAARAMHLTSAQIQREDETVAARFVVLVPDAPALRLRQAAADGQAEPHAPALGREERIEDADSILVRDARPIVRDRNLGPTVALG